MSELEITFEDLSEELPDDQKTFLDKKDIDESVLTSDQLFWRNNGYLIKEKFIPDNLIDAYCEVRKDLPQTGRLFPGSDTPYMRLNQIKDLCLYEPVMDKLKELLGSDAGMHLNLTGWKSTQRNWHQDDYLNPDFIMCHYAAVWFALDDIHPDSGPFEFIPKSHKWQVLRSQKVRDAGYPGEGNSEDWPGTTERFVVPAVEKKIAEIEHEKKFFLAKKGDILIWHAALMHRGSIPNNPDLLRKTIITHYSTLERRHDMINRAKHTNNKDYFVF